MEANCEPGNRLIIGIFFGAFLAVIMLADEVLNPYGGRLFEGYSLGKGVRI
ncbi:hypothetical protein [Sporosarcina sp. BP05]|uniref:hypothetical protein n=1 Tax=Sporosarcina sp. BP05 TaxID=2758726 RepID=UPI001646BCCE|nr:hypothetical protein [Sporosarcina sp. BP05]